jgi:hypothetical protein
MTCAVAARATTHALAGQELTNVGVGSFHNFSSFGEMMGMEP